jgi:hypothetical protein
MWKKQLTSIASDLLKVLPNFAGSSAPLPPSNFFHFFSWLLVVSVQQPLCGIQQKSLLDPV